MKASTVLLYFINRYSNVLLLVAGTILIIPIWLWIDYFKDSYLSNVPLICAGVFLLAAVIHDIRKRQLPELMKKLREFEKSREE